MSPMWTTRTGTAGTSSPSHSHCCYCQCYPQLQSFLCLNWLIATAANGQVHHRHLLPQQRLGYHGEHFQSFFNLWRISFWDRTATKPHYFLAEGWGRFKVILQVWRGSCCRGELISLEYPHSIFQLNILTQYFSWISSLNISVEYPHSIFHLNILTRYFT